MEKLVISTQDLFDECLDIYEYNIDALSLHILFFKKENGIEEKITPQDALNLICDYFVKEGVIKTYKKGTAKFNPTHYWGSEDDEGYRCSCWNVSFNMTISENNLKESD